MKSPDEIKAFLQSRETGITFAQLEQQVQTWPDGSAKDLLLLIIDRHPDTIGLPESHDRSEARERKLRAILVTAQPDWHGELQPCLDAFMDNAWQPRFVSTFQALPSFANWNGYRSPNSAVWNACGFVKEMCLLLLRYRLDVQEYATWCRGGYSNSTFMGFLLAIALNEGDDALFAHINGILQGDAESGNLNDMHLSAFMLADRDDCRAAIVKLLLSAQRQEGLRQSILQTIQMAAPKTLSHLLRCIVENDLLRFKSVASKVGYMLHSDNWTELPEKQQKSLIEQAVQWLDHPDAAEPTTPVEASLALWAQCVHNTEKSLPLTRRLLQSPQPEMRSVALWHLPKVTEIGQRQQVALPFLNDSDKAVAAWAKANLNSSLAQAGDGVFEACLQLLDRMPKSGWSAKNKPWAWQNYALSFSDLARETISLMGKTGQTCERLLPFWDKMAGHTRRQLLYAALPDFYKDQHLHLRPGAEKPSKIERDLSAFEAELLQRALLDRTDGAGMEVIWVLERKAASGAEMDILEKRLDSKNDEVRMRAVRAIAAQEKTVQQASIQRLAAGSEAQRTAALDLLLLWKKEDPASAFLSQMLQFFTPKDDLTSKEAVLLDVLSGAQTDEQFSAENGFGLYDPAKRSPAGELPQPQPGDFAAKIKGDPNGGLSIPIEQMKAKLMELDRLIIERRGVEYEVTNSDGSTQQMVFGAEDNLYHHQQPPERSNYWGTDIKRLPFREVWEKWLEGSGLTALDLFILNGEEKPYLRYDDYPEWYKTVAPIYFYEPLRYLFGLPHIEDSPFKYPASIRQLLSGFAKMRPYAKAQVLYLEVCEHIFNDIPTDKLNEEFRLYGNEKVTWRDIFGSLTRKAFAPGIADNYTFDPPLSDELFARTWRLMVWHYRSHPDSEQKAGGWAPILLFHAYRLGLVTADELHFQILYGGYDYSILSDDRLPQTRKVFEQYPFLRDMVERSRSCVLDIELRRGDTPTGVSQAAISLRAVFGIAYFVRLLKALGDDVFHRGYIYSYYHDVSKRQVMSQLLRRCFPLPEETAADFWAALVTEKFPEKRLVEAALYAPQWLPWTAELLGWPGLQEAAWWLHAHANEQMDAQKETETARYSPISAQSFKDGAVDVAWFRSAYAALGPQRWAMLYDAALYICDSNGHARARLYADAILGKITPADADAKMKRYRSRDNLVAYGLIPLSEQAREADLLQRYRRLQEFKKETRQQGAARKAKEPEAIRYALENLARTAGYDDPMRLVWDMEARDAQVLMACMQTLDFEGGVSVGLVVDALGKADLQATKKGKPMADLPAKAKKDPALLELRELRDQLREQQGRVRRGLEEAMLRGDEFRPQELTALLQHPVVHPLLASLALVSGGTIGFWENGALAVPSGGVFSVPENTTLRIAHCTDLYKSGQWADFQRHLFEKKVVQPFKQVFRELYLLTPDESQQQAAASQRYQGHQVQPTQAAALFRSRGWTVDYSDGFQKIFARENLVAQAEVYADWYNPGSETPEVKSVRFLLRSSREAVPLSQVPPRIFSEVMRDLDLVVSVAHAGGVDPEAGLSSIALRRSIVAETARLFQLDNLVFKEHHVLIRGQLGEYSLHLGSGTVHRMPGGVLHIRAVHTQGRGRIFLPFADDDPKTAELVSKMLLLARDGELKDPTVLGQM